MDLDRPIKAEDPEGQVRIGYFGTPPHNDDLRMIAPVLADFAERDGVTVEVAGAFQNCTPLFGQRVGLPRKRDHPDLTHWLQQRFDWDIALLPRADTAYNRTQSPIKFLEYAAMGAAILASDTPEHRILGRDGENCMLVPNDPTCWEEALSGLIEAPRLRRIAGQDRTGRSESKMDDHRQCRGLSGHPQPPLLGMSRKMARTGAGAVPLVGAARFELTTPCTQNRCATRLRHTPTLTASYAIAQQQRKPQRLELLGIARPDSAVLGDGGVAHSGCRARYRSARATPPFTSSTYWMSGLPPGMGVRSRGTAFSWTVCTSPAALAKIMSSGISVVLHPEAHPLRAFVDKKHTRGLRHRLDMHQAPGPFLWLVRHRDPKPGRAPIATQFNLIRTALGPGRNRRQDKCGAKGGQRCEPRGQRGTHHRLLILYRRVGAQRRTGSGGRPGMNLGRHLAPWTLHDAQRNGFARLYLGEP